MEMQNVKNQVKNVFTPARLKKAAALAVLVGIVSAGGAYWHHRQAEARSALEKQARSEMITAQAAQQSVVLIDEAKVRSIAAEAIGKSESELNFRSVYLTMWDHDDRDDRDDRHDDRHRDGKRTHDRKGHRADRPNHERGHDCWEHRDGRDEHADMMPPKAAPAHAEAENMVQQMRAPQENFHPTYKVKCYAGQVEYKLRIDAVTGTVLSSKVDVDDDLF